MKEKKNKIQNKKILYPTLLGIAIIIGAFTFILGKGIGGTYANPVNSDFDDNNFYECVINQLNKDNINNKTDRTTEWVVTDDELSKLTTLSCSGKDKDDSKKIVSTKGLSKMTNLTKLELQYNKITSVDVTKNTLLTHLDLGGNKLTSVDVSKNTALTYLSLGTNQLTSVDVSKNTALITLYLHKNQLTNVDVSKNTALTKLVLHDNKISTLNITNNEKLTYLDISNNLFSSLPDTSKNTKLTTYLYSGNTLDGNSTDKDNQGENNNQSQEENIENPNTSTYWIGIIILICICSLIYVIRYINNNKVSNI